MTTTTKGGRPGIGLVDGAHMALYDTSLERAFIRYMEFDCDGVEHLLSDPTNANAIYHACRKLRAELEALAELVANENKEDAP